MRNGLILLVKLLVLTNCSSPTKQSLPEVPNDASTLTWATCYDKFQRATLRAPIDYSDETLGRYLEKQLN